MIVQRLEEYSREIPSKAAFIMDDRTVTYGELWERILCCAERMGKDRKDLCHYNNRAVLISERSLYDQCVAWLAALYRGYIPIVCHNEINDTYKSELCRIIESKQFPPTADFGVLTSGTTGTPKPLWRSEASWSGFFDIQNDIFHIRRYSTVFVHGSFSFTGNSNMVIAVLWAGATVISASRIAVRTWKDMIHRHRADHIYVLPTKLRLMVRHKSSSLDSVRYIIAGSQMLDAKLMRDLTALCPNMYFMLYYGATELNYISYCTGQEWLRRPGTVGRPFPDVSVFERDGLLYVNTPYGIEGITMPYTVGDEGDIDDEGYILFKGRQGDVINRGGYKISVSSMEHHIQSLPGVDEVAIIGVPDDLRGEAMVAYIVPAEGVSHQEITGAVYNSLPAVEHPRHIECIPSLPLTECAKVDKRRLKEWYNSK